MSATEIGIGIAAASAVASAASAASSARGVALSHRPFVVGYEYRDWTEILHDQGGGVVGVVLRNDGPGVALGVRYRVRAWSHQIDTSWSPQVGSVRTGEEYRDSMPFEVPPGVTEVELGTTEGRELARAPDYVFWYVETEFADIRGTVWTARYKRDFDAAARPQRVRSRKIDFWRPKGASR
jgi:hypothetical protein